MRTKKTALEKSDRETVARAAAQLVLFMMKTSQPHRDIVVTSIAAHDQADGRPVIEGTNEPSTDWVKTDLELQTDRGVVAANVSFETGSDTSVLVLLAARVGHDKVTWSGYVDNDLTPTTIHGVTLPSGMVNTYKKIELPTFTWSNPTHTS